VYLLLNHLGKGKTSISFSDDHSGSNNIATLERVASQNGSEEGSRLTYAIGESGITLARVLLNIRGPSTLLHQKRFRQSLESSRHHTIISRLKLLLQIKTEAEEINKYHVWEALIGVLRKQASERSSYCSTIHSVGKMEDDNFLSLDSDSLWAIKHSFALCVHTTRQEELLSHKPHSDNSLGISFLK
jgi:hypothetical protein